MSQKPQESRHEWPVAFMWYTKYKGKTIEEIADRDLPYLCWMIKTFQDITPSQAQYIKNRYGREIKDKYIRDVAPYVWQKGDPEQLYMDICDTGDLEGSLKKWRLPEDITLF